MATPENMGPDTFNLLLSGWILIIYGTICILCIIFTFSLELFLKIEEKLSFSFFSDRILSPLNRSIDWFNAWLMKYNGISGLLLILLSLVDLKLAFYIINLF